MSEQELEINEITVAREAEASSEESGLIRYVFEHPEDEEVRIVLSDVIRGFSDRVEAYPELAAMIAQVVATSSSPGRSSAVAHDLLARRGLSRPRRASQGRVRGIEHAPGIANDAPHGAGG
jgi:hypothetical protein